MEKYLFTVVLPVYNVDKYLRECLNSLVNQTYKNFQVIAINDGSTDTSLQILEEYKKKKLDNMIIISQNNMGLSAARNASFPYLNGQYTYFLDSDDYLEVDTFEIINTHIKNTEHRIDLIKFDAYPFLDDNYDFKFNINEYDMSNKYKEKKIYDRNEFLNINVKNFLAPVWLYCVRTVIIKENMLSFEEKLLHEDELFTAILFTKCNNYIYINKKFFNRRYRQNSIMTSSKKNESSIKNYLKVISGLNDYMNDYKSSLSTYDINFLLSRTQSLIYIIHSTDLENKYVDKSFNYKSMKLVQRIKIKIKRKINELLKS